MIYIPTITGKTHIIVEPMKNVLYSPSKKTKILIYGENITIWDNHAYYWRKRYNGPNRTEKAFEHYKWFINFVIEKWIEGVTVVTPDVDWLPDKERNTIEEMWYCGCRNFPQLYIPSSWKRDTKELNIVGYALRKGQTEYHPKWTHCLGHRKDYPSEILTYDSINEILQ